MGATRLNCWEYKKCGREPGGAKAVELGVCPAASDTSFHGLNQGNNAGRICWAVAGTFCGGKAQGTFAEKRGSCIDCDFFKLVQVEEETVNLHTKFLRFFSEDTVGPFLDKMSYKHIEAGKRFISQGEVLDSALVIQKGSCLIVVEKDGELHPVGHRGEGDIVAELAILTGEPQNAHVEAQTDMEVWVLNKDLFDDISKEKPHLLDFLTELVADRFDSNRPIADRVIGKYLATDIAGRGGHSIVYKGVHSSLNMPVVIKMMRHDFAVDPDFLSSFWNEAKTIASLNHENIVKVYDIEEMFRTVFIIMEYVEGESLKSLIDRLKKIPPRVAVDFLVQICSGLDYAHQQGIIHRDINSSNIMVQRNDRLKILDFGLACPIGTEDDSFLGTVFYMAPEQIEGEILDQRTDIYALGITAFEMLTGKRPFPEDDIGALMDMHVNEDIPDPAELVPDLPEVLRRFIMKACHRDPNHRYQNVGQALDGLLPLTNEYGLTGKKLPNETEKLKAIDILVQEHILIREFLDNLTLAVEKLEEEERLPREFFEKSVEFARQFADRFHHFKEEYVMFGLLAQKKNGALDAKCDSLRFQHERGRDHIVEIANSIEGYSKGEDIPTIILLENMAAYISLLRKHIHTEDFVLFPMIHEEVSEIENQALLEEFKREDEKFGDNFLEDNRQLIHQLGSMLQALEI